jgi:hypothetical protein
MLEGVERQTAHHFGRRVTQLAGYPAMGNLVNRDPKHNRRYPYRKFLYKAEVRHRRIITL